MNPVEVRKADGSQPGWARLLEVCAGLPFERHDIAAQLDARGRYDVSLAEDFPLHIRRFHFTSRHHTRGETWHERLELFLPLDGPARFRMGGEDLELGPGDLLVVDSLKVHHVVDFTGFDTRVVVISFLPEFVYSLGSPSGDYAFLLPFYTRMSGQPHVLRSDAPLAATVHEAVAALVERQAAPDPQGLHRAGCKAALLELLYGLARHFKSAQLLKWEFMRQQQRSLRLKRLFDHIQEHFSERLPVAEAARMVGMSAPQFMRVFKQVAGQTLVAYLNHVRLAEGARLLREGDDSIAVIASEVGFSDQSYFDKRFKRAFGQTPKEFRRQGRAP